jgi:hypothetical protein
MARKPIFKLSPVREVARNALAAHRAGRLQATTRRQVSRPGCYYYDREEDVCCVIGASLPPDIGERFDKISEGSDDGGSIVALVARHHKLELSDPDDLRILQALQSMHDDIVGGSRQRRYEFLRLLHELAEGSNG